MGLVHDEVGLSRKTVEKYYYRDEMHFAFCWAPKEDSLSEEFVHDL